MVELWDKERQLWLEGAAAYDRLLHPACIMTFAPPVGIIEGRAALIESVADASRWVEATMSEQHSATTDHAVTLAYRADSSRADGSGYSATCSSTWVEHGGGWRIIQHQQTPLEATSKPA